MESELEQHDNYRGRVFLKVFCFLLGVSALSGWNAILTGLNYFNKQFPEYNVGFTMSIPYFLSFWVIGGSLPKMSSFISLKFRFAYSLGIFSILMVALPIVAEFMSNFTGYCISMALILFIGAFNCIFQNSSIGMSSILGPDCVNVFWFGTGLSGLIICAFRFLSLAAIPEDEPGKCIICHQLAILLYFSVAGFWNIITLAMYFYFKQTSYYEIIEKEHQNEASRSIMVEEVKEFSPALSESLQVEIKQKKKHLIYLKSMGILETLIWISRIAFPVPLFISLIYIITFMMYPGVALDVHFNNNFQDWGITCIILAYNVGDTLGKTLGGFRKLYNQTILLAVVLFRIAFFYPYILIKLGDIDQQWAYYLNTFGFALLNGFATTGLMQLGPEKVSDPIVKEKIGFVMGFSLCFGISLGTFAALPFTLI